MMDKTESSASGQLSQANSWRLIAAILLAVRFTQGWIFWGGGSRRFIYGTWKLDPSSHHWMANKFHSAMPGALLGFDKIVDYMLHHFYLLYASIIFFSLLELIFGLFLIFGFMTRLSAFVTIGISFLLMLLFGWMGSTCIDEWTMASCNFAMGITLFIGGASAYSIDSLLMRKNPGLAHRKWFRLFGSGYWTERQVKLTGVIGMIITIIFVVSTYDHFRGSVYSAFHPGPVSPSKHVFTLTKGQLATDGSLQFTAYLSGGTDAVPANIVNIKLKDQAGKVVEEWNSKDLHNLPKTAFDNDYNYNQFFAGYAGISAELGARSVIKLPAKQEGLKLKDGEYKLVVHDVNGRKFTLDMKLP